MIWNSNFNVQKYSFIGTLARIALYSDCGCFSATKAEVSSYDRDHLALKAKTIYYLVFYREKCAELCSNVRRENHFAKGETEAQRVEMKFLKLHVSEGLLLCQIIHTVSPVLQRKCSKHTDKGLHMLKVTWGIDLEEEICTHPSDLAKPRRFLIAPVKRKKKKRKSCSF